MLLIRGGRVIDPVREVDEIMDVMIEGSQIVETGKALKVPADAEVIDATGLVVAPGLMDAHVHFRDPGLTYKEDIETGAAAAARGGFTTVVCMANTKPVVDNLETLSYVQEKGEQTPIHVLQAVAITKGLQGKELVDMEALADAGAAGFTDDGIPLMDEKLLVQAMEQAKALGLPLAFHEEDPALMSEPGVHKGKVAEQIGYGGAARAAEDVMVARDCMLALHTGASVCIQHISSKNSVELVRLAKMLGADVHAEATPHHFTLTEEAVLKYGTLARMNPPLRTEEDRQAIIKGIQDGTIDMIVTDHAPHSEEEKEEDFLEYLYMGWKSGTEIWPHQVKMHLELMDAELKRLERGLMASGYLRKRAENSGYRLTELGKVQGEECLLRHHNLTQFLQMTCGLEEEEAEENACRMEHVISSESFAAIKQHVQDNNEIPAKAEM